MKRNFTTSIFLSIAVVATLLPHVAKAQTVTINSSQRFTWSGGNLPVSQLTPGTINIPVLGIRFDKPGGSAATALQTLVIQCDQDPTLVFTSVSLRYSFEQDFGGTENVVATGTMEGSPANTITLTSNGSSEANLNTGANFFFLVADIRTDAAITAPIQLSLSGANVTLTSGTVNGTLTSIPYPVLGAKISSLNNPDDNGVAASQLVSGATSQAILGFSLSSTGSQTVSAINVQLTSDPAGKLSDYALVRSTDENYATTEDNAVISTSSIIASGTEVQITPASPINISTGKNLFLVANVDPSVTSSSGSIQASLSNTNVTVNPNFVTGSATGQNYEFAPLQATIGSLNTSANNVASSPIVGGETGQAILGFSLSSNGSQTVSQINVQLSEDPAGIFSNFVLVESADADFATGDDHSTIGVSNVNVTTSAVGFTLTTPLDISAVKNLFLVADVSSTVTNSSGPIQASLSEADITIDEGIKAPSSATGANYNFISLESTITSLNDAGLNNIASSPILGGETGQAIFGFSLSSNGNQTVSGINIQFSDDPTNIFSNFSLIQSDDDDFATTDDNTAVGITSSALTGNTLEIVPSTVVDISTVKNFFLVADVDRSVTSTAGPIQASLNSTDFIVNQGYKDGSATGTAYNFTELTATIASLNASANNPAASPLLGGITGQAIFGFSLSSNGTQTATAINVQLTEDPSGIFSDFALVSSVDNDFATPDDNSVVATSADITVTDAEIQIIPPTGIEFSAGKNLFLVADVDASVTSSSGPIQVSISGTNLTLDYGSATGSATGTNYNFTPLQATIGSLNASANNVAASPILGGSAGEAIFGFSLSSTGSQTVSEISIQFSEDPLEIFSNFALIESADADFATGDDNTPIGVSSINTTTSAAEFTLTTPLDITAARNLFVVADVSSMVTSSSGPIQASLSEANITVNQGLKATSSATGTDYSFIALEATISSLNDTELNNVATSPMLGGETGQAIFGFSLSSSGNQTVSQVDVQFSADPANVFSNFSLIHSDDADFATTGDNATVGTSISIAGNALEIVPSTDIDISTAKNFFLVADVDPSVTPADGPIQGSLTSADFAVNRGIKTGSATGTSYSIAPKATIGSLNAGSSHVATSPIVGASAGEAIFGFSLSSNGSQSVTLINIQLSEDPTGILSNFSLVESADADFATGNDNTVIGVAGMNITTSAVEFTLTTPLDISAVRNLFIVADVDPGVTSSSGSIQASLSEADISVNQGIKVTSSATGTNYSFASLEATISSLNDTGINNVAPSPISGGDTGQAIFGFSLSSNGSQTVFLINVQFSDDPGNIFSNFSLIQSDDADFATAGDNTTVGTSISLAGNTLEIVPSIPIDISTAKNFFLVADVDGSVTVSTDPIQASITTADFTLNQGSKTGSATGINYSFTVVTGIESARVENIEIFPNPANDVLNIALPASPQFNATFKLCDAFGQTIHEGTFGKDEHSKTTSTRELAPGVYLLHIKIDGNQEVTKRVIVVRK